MMPVAVDPEEVAAREAVWNVATELVIPIIEDHGLEEYRAGPQNILVPGPHLVTKVDQNIDHIIRVADWLLDR